MASEFDRFAQEVSIQEFSSSKDFPVNHFHVHTATETTAEQAASQVGDERRVSSSSYAMQTTTLPHGGTFDMVRFLGDHQVLDLTPLMERTLTTRIPAIGGLDLGGHHNELKLSLANVLSLGETDLFINDGKIQLMVSGKDGDSVDLSNSHIAGLSDGEWQEHGTTHVGGVTYNVVEHSSTNTELLIEQAVRIDMH
jgi:hypothetical protein